MAYSIKKETPVKGLTFVSVEDRKSRTDTVFVQMMLPLKEEIIQQCQMLRSLLSESTAVNPDRSKMSQRLMELYGALLKISVMRIGDNAVFSIVVKCIADRYALDGENVTLQAAQLLLDIVFSPNILDGGFRRDYFENAKKDVIELIKSSKSNRHSYAINRLKEIAFEGEPAACTLYGTIEQAEKVTAVSLYESYKKMLDTAVISVYFCSSGNSEKAQQLIKERFIEFAEQRKKSGKADTLDIKDSYISPSPLKPEVREVRESIEQKQLKLVMMFKLQGKDPFAETIAVSLYGGTAFSKLFMNVREKLSLCYYCQSALLDFKNAMIVDSGVAAENEQKAKNEILHQLDLLKEGEFSDEELENTKKSLCGSIRIVPDMIDELGLWYHKRYSMGLDNTPEQEICKINEVTRERVTQAFRGIKLDTVFVLEPADTEGGDKA